jgi:cytidylate kinase
MKTTVPVIAIDGPAASGKSSTARAVAERLGLVHVDSGALYRAATLLAIREGLEDPEAIAHLAAGADVALVRDGSSLRVLIGGVPAEPAIRDPAVTAGVSAVAAMPAVRAWVDTRLRAAIAEWGGGVMDGRDIGTVVFPDARLKVFLIATPEARATRRLSQDRRGVDPAARVAEAARLAERDRLDAGRAVAPLRQAEDALLLDTTDLGFAEQVDRIVGWARDRGLSGT